MVASIFESSAVNQRERWLSSPRPSETRDAYIDASGSFTDELKIVTGEANSKLFNLVKFSSSVEARLKKNPQAAFRLVFHKRESMTEALDAFKKDNPHLIDLKNKYPNQVYFYWVRKRPRQHYAVIDNEMVILEQPDHPSEEPFWAVVVQDYEIATDWERHFDEYLNYCSPMDL